MNLPFRRTGISLAIGLAVSAFFLWLALRQVDFDDLIIALESANYAFVLISSIGLAAGLALRSVRWRLIAGAPLPAQVYFYQATNIGALSNMILPARAGEFIRIFVLARLTGVRLANPVASSLLDRLMDVITIFLVAAALYLVLPRGELLDRWLGMIVVLGVAITAAVFIAAKLMGFGEIWLNRIAERWLQNWKIRPDVFFSELHKEARRVLGSWLSIKLISVVPLILVADCIAIGAQIWAFHLDIPLLAVLLLWVFLVIGSMLPSAPGYIGVYQTAAIWGLSFFSVPPSSAVALAVVLQATTFIVTFVMVGPSFWRLTRLALATERSREA